MPRPRRIPESDVPLIKQWILEGRKYKDIANHYHLKSSKTVSRFVKDVMKTEKYTDISESNLVKLLKDDLQVGHKQTKGFSLLKPALADNFRSMCYIYTARLSASVHSALCSQSSG